MHLLSSPVLYTYTSYTAISPQAHNTVRQQLKRQSTDSLPCSDYDDISFGHRNITGTLPGDTVTFGCDEGFELLGSPELTCETNGNWSGAWPMCVRGMHCVCLYHDLAMIRVLCGCVL